MSLTPKIAATASALLLGTLLAGAGTLPASAADADGLWYYNNYDLKSVHDAGYTGAGLTIAVLDGPLNRSIPQLTDADITIGKDSYCGDSTRGGAVTPAVSDDYRLAVNGTNVVQLLVGNGAPNGGVPTQIGIVPDASILYFATTNRLSKANQTCNEPNVKPVDTSVDSSANATAAAAGIEAALDGGADFILVSEPNFLDSPALIDAVQRSLVEKVPIIVPRTQSADVSRGISQLSGIVTVQSKGADGRIQASSERPDVYISITAPGAGIVSTDVGSGVDRILGSWDVAAPIDNVSAAAAVTTGFLALAKSKYPDAGGNQLLYSMIRNTTAGWISGNLADLRGGSDSYRGFGDISLDNLLAIDPTVYDDSFNPLFFDPIGEPTWDAVYPGSYFPADWQYTGSKGSVNPAPLNDTYDPEVSALPMSIPVLVGIVLAFLAIVVLVPVLLVVRSRRKVA